MPALRLRIPAWLALWLVGALAAQASVQAREATTGAPAAVETLRPVTATEGTHHRIVLDGAPVGYVASFVEYALGEDASPATISATAYVREPVSTARPLLFVFNGGPGASSSPLHFSGIGPKLQVAGGDGNRSLQDNPHSLLDVADLVFIDPPGTGFSQPPQDEPARTRYWSVDGDAAAVLALIRRWRQDHHRQASPLYIAGESYGGYRLAVLSAQLHDLHPAGLLLISPMLDASAGSDAPGNDLPYVFVLPSLAVAAAHAGVVDAGGRSTRQVFDEARGFALGDYARALMQGSALPADARARIERRVAALTGLPVAIVREHDLRIDAETYRNEILKNRGKVLGRLDSRIVADAPRLVANRPSAANDPALGLGATNVIRSPLIGSYLREQLGVPLQRDYVSLSLDVNGQWRFWPPPAPAAPFYFNPTGNIAAVLAADDNARLLVLTGYHDLAVPALAPWYALMHAGIAPARVRYEVLQTGHSVFADAAQRRVLRSMLKEFLQ